MVHERKSATKGTKQTTFHFRDVRAAHSSHASISDERPLGSSGSALTKVRHWPVATDPVEAGIAASLAHPGGNVTGVFLAFAEVAAKWLELLKECRTSIAQ